MTSLWLDRADRPVLEPLRSSDSYEVVVVGAGLTGLVTALLFARAGRSVAVLEGRYVGAVTTGNTTAKISLLQGTRLSEIGRRHSPEVLRDYVAANLEGQQWLLRYCEEHGVPVQREPAYTYAGSPEAQRSVKAELAAGQTAGLEVRWVEEPELPYPTYGAVRLDDQAQLDPMDLLYALTTDIQEHGGAVFEQTRVRGLRRRGGPAVLTDHGEVRAGHVVLATGMPILDRGGFFARLHPSRSYSLAFRTPGRAVHGMYISADTPTRSLRNAPGTGGDLLLVGGNGHTTGRHTPTSELVRDLEQWTHAHFADAELTHTWSAQDYASVSGLPYVGPLLPGDERVLMATGFHKWGMANAAAAALALSGEVLDSATPWARAMTSWSRRDLASVGAAAALNGGVAVEMARGWAGSVNARTPDAPEPAEGEGRVDHDGPRATAVSTVDGRTRRVSAVCPHLGGILRWNDAECSWDCPLHGSRFAADGAVLEGPATNGLANR